MHVTQHRLCTYVHVPVRAMYNAVCVHICLQVGITEVFRIRGDSDANRSVKSVSMTFPFVDQYNNLSEHSLAIRDKFNTSNRHVNKSNQI